MSKLTSLKRKLKLKEDYTGYLSKPIFSSCAVRVIPLNKNTCALANGGCKGCAFDKPANFIETLELLDE